MPKQLPLYERASLDTGFVLFTAKYSERLDGTKAPAPTREWFETREAAELAAERFKWQFRDLPGAITTVVPAAQVKPLSKQRGRR